MKSSLSLIRLFAPVLLCLLTGQRASAQAFYATPYVFTTVAGDAGYGSADGTGTSARFYGPPGVAVDVSGNVYVADCNNHTIRKITSGGVVTTWAGEAGTQGSRDGMGAAARFSYPRGVAVDSGGNVYVADVGNCTIRKITPAGVVSTLAGMPGIVGASDGTGSAAKFNYPQRLTVDGSGNVFVADTSNSTIRKITPDGVVTTIAGSASSMGSTDGIGSAARFCLPTDVVVDSAGNLYVADRENQTIRKIASDGMVSTLAGTVGTSGTDDGTGTAAKFNYPAGLTVDGGGNVYVADTYNDTIRKISSGGVVTTLAGQATDQGSVDGTGSDARFDWPSGITADPTGNLYVADEYNSSIRMVTSAGVVTTLAGSTGSRGSADGLSTSARFRFPTGVAMDGTGNLFIADQQNCTIRKIAANGAVTTFAGLAGYSGSIDGTGSAARFNSPRGVAVDSAGTVYVADTSNHLIRKISSTGVVSTWAGDGTAGSSDGFRVFSSFNLPQGVAVDGTGNVYVADELNHTIRKITSNGNVSTLAGSAGNPGYANGAGSAARFNHPFGVAVDSAGNVYVADVLNRAIRKIASDGTVSTLAMNLAAGPVDGPEGGFGYPVGVAVDAVGNVYVADQFAQRIRKVSSAGFVTSLAGRTDNGGATDGAGSAASFYNPGGIAVDAAGNVYVADTFNNTIRKGFPGIIANDLNGDGKADILWRNTVTGQFCVWLMDGTTYLNWVDFGLQSTDWHVAVTGAFNADGKTDIMWENLVTGERGFWLMNGPTFASWVDIGVIPTAWRVAAAADLNGDGKTDLIWENTVTGERYFWYMNGTTVTGAALLATVSTDWHIAAAADFNADGKPDLLWENTVTGDHYYWFMNNTAVTGALFMGNFGTEWHLAAVADYNGDGKPDLLWENRTTGDRYLWFMNGTDITSAILVGNVSTDWQIVH